MEVCTIIAKNYVAHARVLARSLAEHHPGSRLSTLIIDDFSRYIHPADEPFEVLTPADIDCAPFTHMALRYSVLELSTAVKPWLLRHLIDHTGGPVTYLDPDIKIYGPLDHLDELAGLHGVVLIPHNNHPIPSDGRKPSQVDVMISGVYNLGYVSLAPRPEVERLLDWWAERLRRDCRVDPVWGYFVDQRWFDLVPGFLTDLAIVRDPEYNVAYWNLHSRRLERDGERYLVDGRPLAFFHFSGFDATQPSALSRYQNRIDVTTDPVLERLLEEYAREVMGAGHAISRRWPYPYRTLGDGTEVDDFVRSCCGAFEDDQEQRQNGHVSLFTPAGAGAFLAWLAEEAPGGPPGINRVLGLLYEQRTDLQLDFPDLEGADRDRLLRWAERLGRAECALLDRVTRATNGGQAGRPSGTATVSAPARKPLAPLPDGPWGVNVVGYFHSQEEVGEFARQLVNMFDQQGIPAAPVHDWTIPLIEKGQPYATLPPKDAPYIVNLICSSPDALADFARSAGESFFAGRYSIAFWSGDQPPSARAFAAVQEVWVPSAHVHSALEPVATVPLTSIPIPVQLAPLTPRSRPQLGLPDGHLFLLSIGAGDELDRKNPSAGIEAFRLAFDGDDRAGLLISISTDVAQSTVEQLRTAAAADHAVHLIEVAPGRAAARELMAVCDCYVSLHRSESFGLSLAEAMWLGKPVLATRFSGNVDFMTDDNSLLVDFRRVTEDQANGSDGRAAWASPNIQHAAALMRQLVDEPDRAKALGARAASDIRRTHSPEASAAVIKRRLESIRGAGQGPPPARARTRSTALARVQTTITGGPPPGPRAGSHRRLRGWVRQAVLRGLRPYSAYQEKVNLALLDAIDPAEEGVSVEQAQLLAELRAARELRAAVELQRRELDDLRRAIRPDSDGGP